MEITETRDIIKVLKKRISFDRRHTASAKLRWPLPFFHRLLTGMVPAEAARRVNATVSLATASHYRHQHAVTAR